MSRRIVVLFSGAAIVSLVGLAIAGYAVIHQGSATPTTAAGAPHFVDETAASGVDHVYAGDSAYEVGGGVAVFDCNGDGRPDMYLAGGSNPAGLYRNDSPVGGALKFTQLHDAATDLTGVDGAYPLDVDGDGNVDLAVLRIGETELLRGLGGCRFERANAAWSFDGGNDFTTAFSAKWEGANRLPTLAVGHYLKLDASGKPTLDCAESQLVRPKADGTGYGQPIALSPGYCVLSMLFSDWDLSGRRDLRMTNDRNYYVGGQDQLWRVAPGEAPRPYTDADGWVSLQIFGMGIAGYDVNGDGYPDYFITSQGDNRLQTLTTGAGQPTYRDIAFKRGVDAAQPFTGGDVLPSTAWHPEFQDVNNDGFIDLFVSKGNVNAEPDFATKDPNNLLLGQPDGTFKEAADAAGILNYERGRGAALADFNLDGMLDLVEVNYGTPAKVWRNAGSGDATKPAQMGNWLSIRPSEPGSNPDAIGGWIELKVGDVSMRRELTVGGGHAGGQLGWVHFGLGPAGSAQVRIQWPDGQMGPWLSVDANQFLDIARGATEARPWSPPKS
jgi:hypothetical protein